jgi:hypothetical protein
MYICAQQSTDIDIISGEGISHCILQLT